MSRTAAASRPPRGEQGPPAPPADGWRPMEAAEILCPDAVALYRQGGEALEAAIAQDLHRLSRRANRYPELRPDAWLTLQLLDALRRRPDLRLTGRNPYDPLAPRTAVTADVLRDACERDNGDAAIYRRWVHVGFLDGDLASGRDHPPTHLDPAQPSRLADVRVEACDASPAQLLAVAGRADTDVKSEYSPERCRAWLLLRVHGWPEDKAPPSGDECHAAAREYFGRDIPRDEFCAIRRKAVPRPWQKPGPRRPRGPRD